MLRNALNINKKTLSSLKPEVERKNTLDLRVYQGVQRLRVWSLLQIGLIFVRDTRGTGIKRLLSIHSDDGLNTNLELRFCSAFICIYKLLAFEEAPLSVPYLMSGCSTTMLLQIVNLSSLRLAPQCFAFRLP